MNDSMMIIIIIDCANLEEIVHPKVYSIQASIIIPPSAQKLVPCSNYC